MRAISFSQTTNCVRADKTQYPQIYINITPFEDDDQMKNLRIHYDQNSTGQLVPQSTRTHVIEHRLLDVRLGAGNVRGVCFHLLGRRTPKTLV